MAVLANAIGTDSGCLLADLVKRFTSGLCNNFKVRELWSNGSQMLPCMMSSPAGILFDSQCKDFNSGCESVWRSSCTILWRDCSRFAVAWQCFLTIYYMTESCNNPDEQIILRPITLETGRVRCSRMCWSTNLWKLQALQTALMLVSNDKLSSMCTPDELMLSTSCTLTTWSAIRRLDAAHELQLRIYPPS